jgi:hypothetical protein
LTKVPFPLELTLANNPVARKQLYRPSLIRKLPTLKFIDGKEVTLEERERVELLYIQDASRPSPVFFQDPRMASAVMVPKTSQNCSFVYLPIHCIDD